MADSLRTTLTHKTLQRLEKHVTMRIGMTPDDAINVALDMLEAEVKGK